MTSHKQTAAIFSFLFLVAGLVPFAASAQEGTSFGVGAVVLPRVIDVASLPQSVQQADAHLPGYARQWYIARINLQAGRSINDFVSWSRQALAKRWNDQSQKTSRDGVYQLILASQRDLMQTKPRA